MDAQNLKPHRGTLILILGILGIFCCGIFTAYTCYYHGIRRLEGDGCRNDGPGRQGQHQCW